MPGRRFAAHHLQLWLLLAASLFTGAALPADQRNYFDLCQRVPRMTLNGVEWVRSQAHVRLPFADKDLVTFMLTVPPGFRYNRGIIKDLFIEKFLSLLTNQQNDPV